MRSPWLAPLVFGSDYSHAVGVVQVMLVAIPFFFAANPLLAEVYTARLEHRHLGLGGVSVLGSAQSFAGQLLVGPVGRRLRVRRALDTQRFRRSPLAGRPPSRDRRFGAVSAEASTAPNSGGFA